MTDITVIILTKNEALHIERCLTRIAPLEPREIIVVDSGSTDETEAIVKSVAQRTPHIRHTFVYHEWPGNQAAQFNWALEQLVGSGQCVVGSGQCVVGSWILRLDADEYLYPDTIEEVKTKIAEIGDDRTITSMTMVRGRRFMGHDIRHGRSQVRILRIFRNGYGRSTNALMDEHIVTSEGQDILLRGWFVDDSLSPFEEWKEKHRGYAKREALMVIRGEMNPNKVAYYKLPPYLRAFAYFILRHFVSFGFLDGIPGLMWDFWQGLWYRCLVDREIGRLWRKMGRGIDWDGAFWMVGCALRRIGRRIAGRKDVPIEARVEGRPLVVVQVVKTLEIAYGGPARSVQGLTAALEGVGVETHLVTLDGAGTPWVEGIRHYHCLEADGCADTYRKMCALIDEIRPDFIHTHDSWMPRLHMCIEAARDKGVRYVISPRGSLKTWSRRHKWLKKILGLWLYQGDDLARAAALHVTADDEREQVLELKRNEKIIQVTNGLNLPREGEVVGSRWSVVGSEGVGSREEGVGGVRRRRVLFLSRIHYTKGLMNLVEAWGKIRPSDWELEIVGTDADGYQAELEKRVKELELENSVIFSGPVDDQKKWEKYRAADLFVLPTFTENFGIVIAEALYAGVPAITTIGAPWQDLVGGEKGVDEGVDEGVVGSRWSVVGGEGVDEGVVGGRWSVVGGEEEKVVGVGRCGWWIEIGVEPLVKALEEAMALDDATRAKMGARGHDLVVEKYSWPSLGRKMKEAYEGLLR